MMNLRKLFCTAVMAGGFVVAHSQYALNLKPGPAEGMDAEVSTMDSGCQNIGLSQPVHLSNFGSAPTMHILDWTWNETGCKGSTGRMLIKFSELNALPAGAVITNATLKLYHPPASPAEWGNSYFPGTALSYTNEGKIYLVDRSTSGAWNESTVTWANKPAFETGLYASMPVSATRWGGVSSTDVTTLVQAIVNGGGLNNGFYIKLSNEKHYRQQVFASSDYADAALWPELLVEYSLPGVINANVTLPVSSGLAAEPRLSISPNPAKAQISVYAGTGIKALRILSATGSTIPAEASIHEDQASVMIANLSPGLYFIEVATTNGKALKGKFIKE